MRTTDIFSKLIYSIKSDPSAITNIPWNDVKLCVLTELDYRNALYTAEQRERLCRLIDKAFMDITPDIICSNTDRIISFLEKMIWALELLPDYDHTQELISQANFEHACLDHYKNDTIIVLGDSHVNFFSGNEDLSFIPIGNNINTCHVVIDHPFTPLHIGPCLAYNCNRSGTTVQCKEKTEYLCRNFIKPGAKILCCFGEIDIRVHVFKQADLQNKTYEQIVDDILTQYIQFLTHLQSLGYSVSCWGPIASQKDNCPLDPNFPRNGSETERNKATGYFTEQLSQLCRKHDIAFLSIFKQMISSDYRTNDVYLSPDRCHLGQEALPLAREQWEKFLF